MNDEIELAVVSAEGIPSAASMQEFAEALVEQARADGVDLTGEGGLLTGFLRQLLQTGLEVEMEWGTFDAVSSCLIEESDHHAQRNEVDA